ncbi:MAG: DUF2283 domain-containing protein [Acidobacteria bacterium]|nr:DUF2283 domain-containing protein [Acidobacteriota bacterium]
METLKILEKPDSITWEYDEEADVLYLSMGAPQPAISLDLGDGLVARYDEQKRQVVGLTILGFRERLVKSLAES